MCCSAARIVFSANSKSLRLFAGGSSARITGLFLATAALEILTRYGLVISLYQRMVRCKLYHFEIYVAMLVESCRERGLFDPLARIAEERLLWLFIQRNIV